MIASLVLTLPRSPILAAPNQLPPGSFACFSAILCDAVFTGVLTNGRLFGLAPPLARAAAMFTLSGSAGTGGGGSSPMAPRYAARGVPPLLSDRWCVVAAPGDGDLRKVRSVMDPEEGCLLSAAGRPVLGLGFGGRPLDTDALLRTVRFVWTSATLVGVVGRARRAAAAAAALRDPELESRRVPEKAERAADAAEGLAVEAFSGYICVCGG